MHVRPLAAMVSGLTVAVLVVAAAGQASATPIPPGGGSAVPDSAQVNVSLTLTGANGQLNDYASAMSSPDNPAYRHRLTREQLRARYGAPSDRVARVSAWARSAGFRVQGLDSTGTRLTVTGTARSARAAFGVNLTQRVVDGVRVQATASQPRTPTAIANDVRAVTGLSQQVAHPLLAQPGKPTVRAPQGSAARPPAGRPGAQAASQNGEYCSTYWAEWNKGNVPQKYPAGRQSNPLCGYSGPQLRALYGLGSADTGRGQTVVIVGAYNGTTTLADANTTFAANGVPALPASRYQVKTYEPEASATGCDPESWHAEQALDVQTVHTLAPDATIVYAASPNCTMLAETLARVVDDSSIPTTIISNSWAFLGEPTDGQFLAAVNNVLAACAVLGIGTYFGSGDAGDYSSVPGRTAAAVSFPASSPWTTAVGGTSTGIDAANHVAFQTGWEDGGNVLAGGSWQRLNPAFLMGAGGGASSRFDKPDWQQAAAGTKRSVPDVSALADPYTGFYVGYTATGGQYTAGALGGTSLATPIIAALVADAQARAGADADVGFLAPVLYAKAAAGKAATVDVQHVAAGVWTPGVSATSPAGDYLVDFDVQVQSLRTGPGYDTVTGLGAPGTAFLSEIVS